MRKSYDFSNGIKNPYAEKFKQKKMKVNLEELFAIQKFKSKINKAELSNIKWYYKGKLIIPPENSVEEFKFVGLCNTSFGELVLKLIVCPE